MTKQEKIDYIDSIDGETLSPAELSKLIGGKPFSFNTMYKNGTLPFPSYLSGHNLRIFKEPVRKVIIGDLSFLYCQQKEIKEGTTV